ncbi:MAG TPA: NAD-dependent epimerase/dehydratase family protein [Polyangiaceae bacterium]|nr:NAD-dependent epimerase/dehydratase family protein [Polyangiaceae bacterium]
MKVVVTGGAGQLGTAVLERLVADRKVKKIVSLDLKPPFVPSPRIDFRIADLRDPGLERHLEGADVLVHLAFIVAKRSSAGTMRAVNVEGSRRIFEAAARHGVSKIVYTSSVAAYGVAQPLPEPVLETTERRRSPLLTYADNKWEVEDFLDHFEKENASIRVVRLRPGILLGRRIAHVSEAFLSRRVLPIAGPGRAPIVWDEDVADAVMLGLRKDVRGAFNLVAEGALTGEELARLAGFRAWHLPRGAVSAATKVGSAMAKILGERRFDTGWLAAAEHDVVVSGQKALAELEWKPRYPTAADVAIAFGKNAPRGTDRRIGLFLGMVGRLSKRARATGEMPREAQNVNLVVHLDVTGGTGGDFTLKLEDGVLSVTPGIPRPPDSTVTLSAETFLELLSGKTEASTASMVGKIRVRGEPLAGLVIGGIVSGFRRATEARGAEGRVARGLSAWFSRGAAS